MTGAEGVANRQIPGTIWFPIRFGGVCSQRRDYPCVVGGSIYSLITGESHIQIQDAPYLEHVLHTAPGLVAFAFCGILLFFVVLHIARAVGWVHGKIAEGLLVRL